MHGRLAEVTLVTVLAACLTAWLAAPVLRAPGDRLFGAETVGRHHDPFTVMRLFESPIRFSSDLQPLTDVPGALIARVAGSVQAYNVLVLISFPLAAGAAYLLARHLLLAPAGAAVAALAFAFSPFHLAHAAYHPHIAQVQWIPLYLLALWRCVDRGTGRAVAVLGAAIAGVTLSNYYGGFIAAIISPIAIAAYWFGTGESEPRPVRRLAITLGTLSLAAATGAGYLWWTAHAGIGVREALAFPRLDLFRYSARSWSYLVPPVEHPWLGPAVSRFWTGAGVDRGLLEQQVSLGWGVMALALVAMAGWSASARPTATQRRVPILVVVAAVALVCSLSPETAIGPLTVRGPSALLYELWPMVRSYARFGVVVQLMAVLLAGLGVDLLWRARPRLARPMCIALIGVAVAEYAVLPSMLWRDVLPTAAHRWVMQHDEARQVIDCVPLDQDSASIPWLTNRRIVTLSEAVQDCREPNLAQKLAAQGYTHVLMRRGVDKLLPGQRSDGFQLAASFTDGEVFTVTAAPPTIYTTTMIGFSPREHGPDWSWQWMGAGASWTVVSATTRPIVATLDVEVAAFGRDRSVTVLLDGQEVQTLMAEPVRGTARLGPMTLSGGAHELTFRPTEPPTVADDLIHNRDHRPLSVAIGTWAWHVAEAQP